jgi:hypothetical protein
MVVVVVVVEDKVILLQLQKLQSCGFHRFEFCAYAVLDQSIKTNQGDS